jgi:hypothetical protein
VSSDDDRDVMSFVKYRDLVNQTALLLGDDLPPAVASPLPNLCRSAIRASKATPDAVRHYPISPLIKSSFLIVQKTRLGLSTSDISSRPPVHFKPFSEAGQSRILYLSLGKHITKRRRIFSNLSLRYWSRMLLLSGVRTAYCSLYFLGFSFRNGQDRDGSPSDTTRAQLVRVVFGDAS